MDSPNQTTADGASVTPPVAPKIPHDVTAHDDDRIDEYYWLRERENEKVLDHLRAENAYTRARLKHTEPLQNKLYDELRSHINETDSSVPEHIDDYYYYTRTEAGLQYGIHCRRKGSLDAPEEILVDENELAEGNHYFSIGGFAVSPDHSRLLYSYDVKGDESYSVFVKEIASGEIVDAGPVNTYYGLEWAADGETYFYTTLDESLRPDKLFRRKVGTDTSEDVAMFHEPDGAFFLGLHKTRSDRYIILTLGSNTTTEVHYLDAEHPEGEFKLFQPRQHEMEYYVDHQGENFYILTNDSAKNFKVMEAPTADPQRDNWREVVPHRSTVKIDEIYAFECYLVLWERESGLRKIQVIETDTGNAHYVKLSESVYTLWPAENSVYSTTTLRFNYSSMVTPRTVIDFDMVEHSQRVMKVYEVPGGYDPGNYVTERVHATANDGSKVPISLVYHKDTKKDGTAPLFLYGYGSYGASIEPYFVANRISILDRGFVYAIAHVRGGGEMGRQWYDQGKLLQKRNTFTDFIACAEHLIDKGYTASGRIACYGGSAGGLLMGAVVNMRPDLWGAVVAHVPFVDVLTTMLDATIPLTVIEYEEWGNPNEKKFYEYMRSYSPYDNVAERAYPNMLVTGGLNDPRVQYWEPAKWVARLRQVNTGDNYLLLKIKMEEGHGGASGRYDYLKDVAFEFAFVLDCMGMGDV